jgi:hypothetical protein
LSYSAKKELVIAEPMPSRQKLYQFKPKVFIKTDNTGWFCRLKRITAKPVSPVMY